MTENKTRWESNLTLHSQNDDAASSNSSVYEEDKPHQASVGPFMCDLFKKQLYTDVEFVSKKTKESVSAHRAVVAAKCSHFESLLFGKQTNGMSGMKLQVDIKYNPFSVFKDVIEYLYTDSIYFSGISYVLNVQAIAMDLNIVSLLYQCDEYIEAFELNEDNVCSTLQLTSEKNAEELRKRCIEYIKKNTSQVISSPDFEKCSFSTAREICDLQDLNLDSESQILEASMRWVNVQPEHTRDELKRSMMKCIRFLSFSSKEFGDLVRQYRDMLSNVDALAILMYLNDRKSKNVDDLPDWINRGRRTFKRDNRSFDGTKGIIKIPLSLAPEHETGLTHLTSILQMHCTKGSQRINALKFSLPHSPPADSGATLFVSIIVSPKRHTFEFEKSMNSSEMTLVFDRPLFVSCGQTLHLKVRFKCGVPCRFMQFDEMAVHDFQNEHFKCCLSSRPTKGKFFVLHEVEYSTRHLPMFIRRYGPVRTTKKGKRIG